MSIPLQNHLRFASSNFDSVQQELCRALTPHRLRLLDQDVPIDACINHVKIGGFELQAMTVGPAVEVLPVKLDSFYMIHMPANGKTQFQIEDQEFEAANSTAAVMSPGLAIRSRWGRNCSAVLLTINRRSLHNHLSQLLGKALKEDIVFCPRLDMCSREGAIWGRLWKYIIDELEVGPSDHTLNLRIVDINKLLMTTLLSSVENNYSPDIASKLDDASDVPACVIKAENFIRENASERPSVSEIANAAGVSARTLHKLFLQYKGLPPQQALLRARLQAVRDELERCGVSTKITDVALRWSFFDLGRFAGQYKRLFGEIPSQTVMRRKKSC